MIRLNDLYRGLRKAVADAVRNDAGSAIIEMGLSSALLLASIFGIFQVTMACYTYNCVSEAARESARWGIVRGTKCSTYTPGLDHCPASATDIQNHAKTSAAINWSNCTSCVQTTYLKASTVTDSQTFLTKTTWATCGGGCAADPGNLEVVVVSYPYTYSIPFVKQFTVNLTSTADMVVSQ